MSRKISFKGQLNMGTQDTINLRTIKGKVGYKITKFQIISQQPGQSNVEFVAKIFKKDQTGSISPVVEFTDSNLLAVAYTQDEGNASRSYETIIFDNEMFNQDIYITADDAASATTRCNYYIELETRELSEIETTQLTLKNLRTVSSQ